MDRTRRILDQLTENIVSASVVVDGMCCSVYKNGCGTIKLDREEAMNSLSVANIIFMYETLLRWEKDNMVTHIVIYPGHITSNSSNTTKKRRKAFCAGGDLKEFISSDRKEFTYREYRMDCLINKYPKPIITLLDGIVMGGGAGVGCLAKFRIVTPNTLFSMPEASIGWNTDCGSSYFLSTPRVDGCQNNEESSCIGEYLVTTGCRLKAKDLMYINIGTHFVSSSNHCNSLLQIFTRENIRSFDDVSKLLDKETESIEDIHNIPSTIYSMKDKIKEVFSASTIEEIFERLSKDSSEWSKNTLNTLHKQCPSSLKVVLKSIKDSRDKSIEDCLKTEFRIGLRLMDRYDLQEGVAAILIRKDNNPCFNPSNISDVDINWVNSCFEPSPIDLELNHPPIPNILN